MRSWTVCEQTKARYEEMVGTMAKDLRAASRAAGVRMTKDESLVAAEPLADSLGCVR
ncbi:hypothetical protein R3Q06_31370 [Rhodococcus erythropolis]|uniref:hypothetical protein n=1 Tax=Rhodococcus erythropolis TaxID=1833 RepID=UPI00294A1ACA|nr:hypothetical protein [Rhodococcus erythropolis]MDV6277986.1 hypothetical protein [Rhodococcus erythropolis]